MKSLHLSPVEFAAKRIEAGGMGRLGLGLLAALAGVAPAFAQEAPPDAESQAAAASANAHCAALGEGFFAVTGSSACMRISGHVSAGVGFAAGGVNGRILGAPTTGSFTEEGVSGDLRFETPIGPGRVYVHVHNANGSRWLTDNQ
jgi:hypothetical protein